MYSTPFAIVIFFNSEQSKNKILLCFDFSENDFDYESNSFFTDVMDNSNYYDFSNLYFDIADNKSLIKKTTSKDYILSYNELYPFLNNCINFLSLESGISVAEKIPLNICFQFLKQENYIFKLLCFIFTQIVWMTAQI